MDARFDMLAEPERSTWIDVWRGMRMVTADTSFDVSAAALEVAIAALEPGDAHASWVALRCALAGRNGDTVQIRRWSLFS
jgi:hypothetical protein